MKNKLISIIIVSVFIVFTNVCAQWIKTYTPYNGFVSCLSSIQSNIYAGSNGVLFVSSNSGNNWKSIAITDSSAVINCVVGNYKNIIIGTYGNGIFKSTDHGNNWESANDGITNYNITSMAYVDSLILAGSFGSGIFLSTNYGITWKSSNSGLTNDTITSLMITDSTVIAGSSRGTIFISKDRGLHWNLIPIQNTSTISSFVKKGTILFAGTNGNGIYISHNDGKNWSASNNGLYNHSVTSLAANDSSIYASTNQSGVFLSTNEGTIWNSVPNGLNDSTVTSIVLSDSNIFAGTMHGGVFRSTNNGTNWFGMNTGLISTDVNVFMTTGTDVFAGTKGAGVLFSNDRGKSWTTLNSGLNALNVVSLSIHDSTIFAATYYDQVYKSSDYGKNWIPTSINSIKALANSDSIMYAANGNNGIYKTIDGGNSWQNFVLGSFYPFLNFNAISAKDSFVITGNSIGSGVYFSSNYGKDWINDDNFGYINVLGWYGNKIVAGTQGGLFFNTINNSGWTRKYPPKPDFFSVISMAVKDSILIAGTYNQGIYLSTDWGENWAKIDSGSLGEIHAVAIVGSDAFAADLKKNIWKRSLSEVITKTQKEKANVGSDFNLGQNYPNPFNPSTTITFSLPTKTFVSLKVYDMLGREVEEIVNQELFAGEHLIQWNAVKYPSGVYFYRLQTDSFIETKKLLFLK